MPLKKLIDPDMVKKLRKAKRTLIQNALHKVIHDSRVKLEPLDDAHLKRGVIATSMAMQKDQEAQIGSGLGSALGKKHPIRVPGTQYGTIQEERSRIYEILAKPTPKDEKARRILEIHKELNRTFDQWQGSSLRTRSIQDNLVYGISSPSIVTENLKSPALNSMPSVHDVPSADQTDRATDNSSEKHARVDSLLLSNIGGEFDLADDTDESMDQVGFHMKPSPVI